MTSSTTTAAALPDQATRAGWLARAEPLRRLRISTLDFLDGAEGLDDEIDGPVLQMQPAIGQTGSSGTHFPLPSLPPSSRRTLWRASTSSSVTAREA